MRLWAIGLGTAVTIACQAERVDSGAAGSAGLNQGGASDSGSGGLSGTPSSGGVAGVCPSGLPGPALVAIQTPQGWFCIDGTEVKNTHYADFIDTDPSLDDQPEYCSFNQSFTSFGTETKEIPRNNYPFLGADWCDARAYCRSAGKRLCGRIGGGPLPYDSYASASESEWFYACSAGGTRIYSYGNSFNEQACALGIHTVGLTCPGGFPGLYDMSGNAAEWDDCCEGWTGPDDQCRSRASGAYPEQQRCHSVSMFGSRSLYAGIRCCADAVSAPQ